MLSRQDIRKKIIETNKDIKPSTLYIYDHCDKEGNIIDTFAIFYSENKTTTSGLIKPAMAKELLLESKGKDVNEIVSLIYSKCGNNPKILDKVADCFLKGKTTMEDIISHINIQEKENQPKSEEDDYSILKPNGTIYAYEVKKDGTLMDNFAFKAILKIEQFGNKKRETTRCYVDEAESFARGKGIYREVLTKFLPPLCAQDDIPAIVLQASAFDIENEKCTQDKLEKFYKDNGFTQIMDEDSETEYATVDDFRNGLPVYIKVIDPQQVFDIENQQ